MTAVTVRCSWCGTGDGPIVAGPGVFICGPCLGQCLALPAAPEPHGPACRCPGCCCTWCGASSAQRQHLVAGGTLATGGTARICTDCIELCTTILDDDDSPAPAVGGEE
jgi:ClpX C4-type zinc finger protein